MVIRNVMAACLLAVSAALAQQPSPPVPTPARFAERDAAAWAEGLPSEPKVALAGATWSERERTAADREFVAARLRGRPPGDARWVTERLAKLREALERR